jgi:hypothetical protein
MQLRGRECRSHCCKAWATPGAHGKQPSARAVTVHLSAVNEELVKKFAERPVSGDERELAPHLANVRSPANTRRLTPERGVVLSGESPQALFLKVYLAHQFATIFVGHGMSAGKCE